MALGSKYRLEEFAEVFDLRDSDGRPFLLIGGQAVNYWAERYRSIEPSLELFQPFTSEDIDFKGNRSDVELIAKQLNLKPAFPDPKEMTSLAGVIPFCFDGFDSCKEVVRTIPGAPSSAEEAAIEVEWNGKQLRILDPVSLFASKLKLLATVSQANRQDAQHLRILVKCVRSFLGELLEEVHRGQVPSRHWLNIVSFLRKTTATKQAMRISAELGLVWYDILPWDEIGRSQDSRIMGFLNSATTHSQDSKEFPQ